MQGVTDIVPASIKAPICNTFGGWGLPIAAAGVLTAVLQPKWKILGIASALLGGFVYLACPHRGYEDG